MTSSPPNPTSPPPDTPVVDDDDDGEDIMGDNMAGDYAADPNLDTYEEEDIDSGDYDAMNVADRRAAERLLEERDRREGRGGRTFVPHALLDDDEEVPQSLLQQRRDQLLPLEDEMADEEEDSLVNLEDYDGPLREWLDEERVRREVQNRFKQYLTQFTDTSGNAVYPEKIKKMCQENKCSLEISYMQLGEYAPVLAIWVVEQPQTILDLFDAVAMQVAQISFPKYDSIHPHIHVRVGNLPIVDELRDLRQLHLNGFVQVTGVVTRRTSVFPQLQLVRYDCLKCGFLTAPIAQVSNTSNSGNVRGNNREARPLSCPDCQSSGPFKMNETETIYRNYQKIALQESPGSVPAGRIPRSRDVILVDDLCDSIRPGEQIKVTGIYKNIFDISMNAQQGFPVFATIIEANNVVKEQDFYATFQITDEDRQEIVSLSKNPEIETIILNSIAPSIYGYEYIKRAIAYALFGGQEKKHANKHRVRSDINMLILGDPGCGKSQFLKYVENVAFRSVYATGKGASAVGLTASVRRDPMTGEWTLEGGALVLADRGVCLIDEFDKMNDQDRTSIHEAMEQQSISISKAGIVASLQARCSVIAAANPIRGRYDGSLTFVENVDLTDPILSRFDVLAVVRDRVDPVRDERLADFVVSNHMKNHPENVEDDEKTDEDAMKPKSSIVTNVNGAPCVSQTLLRKYILYAKQNCHPKLDNIDRDKIAKFYSELRQKSMQGGGIPIAVRHIESMLRLSEARAKLHLREYVRADDVDMAIRVLLESFIDTQKQSVQTTLRRHFKNYLSYQKDTTQLLLHLLENEVKEELNWRQMHDATGGDDIFGDSQDADLSEPVEIDLRHFEDKAENMQIASLNMFFKSLQFKNSGYTLNRKKRVIVKTLR